MTAILVGHFVPDSPEWHAARANGLGGSEIAAVLGLSKYESAFSLWHRKAGNVPPQSMNNEMEAGKRLEPVIAQWWAEQHPELNLQASPGTYRHSERAWQIANPDGLVFGDDLDPTAVLEVKFALYADEWGEPGTDEIPPYYLTQTRWYLDVFGLDVCHLAVFIGGCAEFREYVIRQDIPDRDLMRAKGADFMASLGEGRAPAIDGHSETYRAVRELHPKIDGDKVEVPGDVARLFCQTRKTLDAAKTAAQQATSLLADAMGNAKTATFLGQKIADRRAKTGGVPYVQAAKTLPDFDLQGDAA